MDTLTRNVFDACGFSTSLYPDSVNCNYYPDGTSGLGWHSDGEMLFQSRVGDTMIISLSIGATRVFEFKENFSSDIRELSLASGDIMIYNDYGRSFSGILSTPRSYRQFVALW